MRKCAKLRIVEAGQYTAELQKRADRADQSVLFFLAGANFWEKHAKNRRKHAKTGENTRKQAKNRRFFSVFFVPVSKEIVEPLERHSHSCKRHKN